MTMYLVLSAFTSSPIYNHTSFQKNPPDGSGIIYYRRKER